MSYAFKTAKIISFDHAMYINPECAPTRHTTNMNQATENRPAFNTFNSTSANVAPSSRAEPHWRNIEINIQPIWNIAHMSAKM